MYPIWANSFRKTVNSQLASKNAQMCSSTLERIVLFKALSAQNLIIVHESMVVTVCEVGAARKNFQIRILIYKIIAWTFKTTHFLLLFSIFPLISFFSEQNWSFCKRSYKSTRESFVFIIIGKSYKTIEE